MKKIVLGLALCLGLSQVVVAEKTEVRGLNAAFTWIKNNPKKAAAIGTAIVAALTYGTFAGVEIYKADGTKGKLAKVRTGLTEAAKDLSVYPAQLVAKEVVAGKDAVVANMKAHPRWWIGVPAGVVAVIVAAVIAEYTTDKDFQLKLSNLWNKYISSKKAPSTEEVVAN